MSESVWILRAVTELQRNGSWTGRTHVHKLLYMADRLLDIKQPFEFELYRFGPYSYALDAHLRLLEGIGLIHREQRHEGYGPSYRASDGWDVMVAGSHGINEAGTQKLAPLAKALGDMQAADLEVIATCLWAIRDEELTEDQAIIQRVLHLKPKYPEMFVGQKLSQLRDIGCKLEVVL